MLKWNEKNPIGEIIQECKLPVFIRKPTFNYDFFVLLDKVENGIASGEGYKMAEPTGRRYSYQLHELAFDCDLADVLEARDIVLEYLNQGKTYHLPKRANGHFHECILTKLPPYLPGETVLQVRNGSTWGKAVVTGFGEWNGIPIVYTYKDGKEIICKLDEGNMGRPVPKEEWDYLTEECVRDVKGWSSSRSDIIQYLENERHVRYLVHFTPVENLKSILVNGIAPRLYFEDGEDCVVTDETRLDNHPECSCFSISFPNYQMFYRKRVETGKEFAVLLIKSFPICWTIDFRQTG